MNSPAAKKATPGGLANISEDTLRKMVEVQAQKIQLEIKQADIALKELDHNQKLADKSIDAQANDRKDDRLVKKTMHLHGLLFAGFTILVVVVFLAIALVYNKDALALDVVKVLCGFAGGWGVSKATQKKASDSDTE